MAGIGCQASGVQSMNTQPMVCVWSWENGRRAVPVRTDAIQRAEWRALLWRPFRLREGGSVRLWDRVWVSLEGVGGLGGMEDSPGRRVLHRAWGLVCS